MAASALAAGAMAIGSMVAAPTASAYWQRPPLSYTLTGDVTGSTFEGIGVDQRSGSFYVSERSGGEIHRGTLDSPATQEWLSGEGVDGRWSAAGVTVDKLGRIYIAGGSNSFDYPGAPDLWVYSSTGMLLAALSTGAADVMMNDVAIGPDGAAYFTDSNTPRLFRVSEDEFGWSVSLWRDASATIEASIGSDNLSGIVATPDGKALLAVQRNAGKLWRFDMRAGVGEVAVEGSDLRDGDSLMLQGSYLTVVRNSYQLLTTIKLDDDWSSATLVKQLDTPQDRFLTAATVARGRLLAVDGTLAGNPALPSSALMVLPAS